MKSIVVAGIALLFFITTPIYADRFQDMMHSMEKSLRTPDKETQVEVITDDDKSDPNWKKYKGSIPANAVIGGREGNRPLYICQAPYNGGVHPGKIVDGGCNITFGGHEIQQPLFRVLVGSGFHWKYVEWGELPNNAVSGGSEQGHQLIICQARYAGGIHPGKVVAGTCRIGYGGAEIKKDEFRVLVRDDSNDDGWGADAGRKSDSGSGWGEDTGKKSDGGWGAN